MLVIPRKEVKNIRVMLRFIVEGRKRRNGGKLTKSRTSDIFPWMYSCNFFHCTHFAVSSRVVGKIGKREDIK